MQIHTIDKVDKVEGKKKKFVINVTFTSNQ